MLRASEMGTKKSKPKNDAPEVQRSTITSSDKVRLQMKLQRDNLQAAIRKYERVAETEHGRALEFLKAGNKRKALYCLKREKAQHSQIDGVTDMLDNVQRLIDTVEFAQIEKEVYAAMRDGKTQLDELNKLLNIDDIEALMIETSESVEEARQIDAVLSQPLVGVGSDDSLLRELESQIAPQRSRNEITDVQVPQEPLPERTEDDVPESKVEKNEGREKQYA